MSKTVEELEKENSLLRKVIEMQQKQMQNMAVSDEVRRLRAKIAEWEGSTRLVNGGYYHGDRFIHPYMDLSAD